MSTEDFSFVDDQVIVKNYPYKPSSCYPNSVLAATDIMDISLGFPITMRLTNHDVIFVSEMLEKQVQTFADRCGIPIVNRYDPWSFVLEKFLDTEYTPETHIQMIRLLALNGISEKQCLEWHRRFEGAMISYNFMSGLWDWTNLDATDLLDAHMGLLASNEFKLGEKEFEELYKLVISVLFQAVPVPQR